MAEVQSECGGTHQPTHKSGRFAGCGESATMEEGLLALEMGTTLVSSLLDRFLVV